MIALTVKNWSSFQSYKDRRPPWIRLHKTLLDNYEFQSLSADARAFLPMLWLLASEHDDPTSGIVESTIDKISFRLRIKPDIVSRCIKELQGTDFIECNETVTKPLRNRNPRDRGRGEAEAEESQNICVPLDFGFEEAWALYGRKGSKQPSLKRWKQGKCYKHAEDIMNAIPHYLQSERVQKGFKRDFQTWLRDAMWETDWTKEVDLQTKLRKEDEIQSPF